MRYNLTRHVSKDVRICEGIVLNRLLIAAVIAMTFGLGTARAELGDVLAARGFVLLAHDDTAPPQAAISGVTRDTFSLPEEGPTHNLPVDSNGALSLAAEVLPPSPEGALGWLLEFQYDPGPSGQSKRTAYRFLDRNSLGEAHILKPSGSPSATATVKSRAVMPARGTRSFELGKLPPGARFQTGTALLNDWRIDGACGARFVVSIRVDGADAQVLHESSLTFDSAAEAAPPWTPVDIDLAPFAGKHVTLVLDTFDAAGAPSPNLAVPLWGDPVVYATTPANPPRQSVLLVSLDTVRADRLGCYGYPRGTTPHLDALAGESYLFENALTPAPMTTPAHASVFTGVAPYLHRAGVYSEGFRLTTRWPPLATLLTAQGYRTAAFTEGIAVAGTIGFSRGFQSYSDGVSPESHDRGLISLTFSDTAAWLRQFGHLPSFVFAHTYHAHDPYTAPDAYYDRFTDPAYTGNLMASPKEAKTPEQRRNASDCYDAGLAYTDAKFGEFIQGLRDTNILDNRWLVVFSDHGEEFWEHGGVTHARALYRESVHVPLLIRPPGGLGGGKRVANPVLITDLFATILEITGSPLPGDRDSIDLMKLAQGPVGLQEVLHGFYRGYEFPKAGQSETKEWETFSVRTPSFTYITTAPQMKGPVKEEVFAPQDIGEREDLTSARPELLEAARRALEEHRKASDAKRESDAVPTPGLNQSEIEALRGIGYF